MMLMFRKWRRKVAKIKTCKVTLELVFEGTSHMSLCWFIMRDDDDVWQFISFWFKIFNLNDFALNVKDKISQAAAACFSHSLKKFNDFHHLISSLDNRWCFLKEKLFHVKLFCSHFHSIWTKGTTSVEGEVRARESEKNSTNKRRKIFN